MTVKKLQIEVPAPDRTVIAEILEAVKSAGSAYITMHARPDGDAIGGAVAISKVLKSRGVDTVIIAPGRVPEVYEFLAGMADFSSQMPEDHADLGIILDCSDTNRLERFESLTGQASTIINIDHHRLNQNFGNINYVRPLASSVCEMIMYIIIQANIELTYEMALAIYIGILTDTNRFQEQNTSPQSHIIAAELIRRFVSPVDISSRIYGNLQLNTLKLKAIALDSLRITEDGKIGYIIITPHMMKKIGVREEHLEGLINYARNIKGVRVGILFRKIPGLNGIKVSFRSKGEVDVGEVAAVFGGGGHHNAAGCTIKADFDEAVETVLAAIKENFA